VRQDGQQQRRRQRQPEVAAVPERQVVVVDVEAAEHQVAERQHADAVEDRADEWAGAALAQLDRAPDQRQGDAGEQADGVRVGAVVDARGVVPRVEEDPGEGDRGEGSGDHAEQQAGTAEELHPGGEEQGPEEVELLLDRERPEVAEEGRPLEGIEVGLVAEDEVPVGEVEERGQRVATQLVDPVRLDDRGEDHRHRDQDSDGGQQPPRPAQPEAAQPQVAVAAELAEQQRGDQVAADHEEDVDPEEAPRHPADAGVVEEDGEHGERPQGVDAWQVGEAAVLGPTHSCSTVRLAPGASLRTACCPRRAGCIMRELCRRRPSSDRAWPAPTRALAATGA